MNSFIVLALCVAVAVAGPVPQGGEKDAVVLRYDNDNIGVEGFKYALETSNSIQASADGQLKAVGEGAAVVVRGQFSYVAPDGITYSVSYIADENGFQPQGAHLPVAPQ